MAALQFQAQSHGPKPPLSPGMPTAPTSVLPSSSSPIGQSVAIGASQTASLFSQPSHSHVAATPAVTAASSARATKPVAKAPSLFGNKVIRDKVNKTVSIDDVQYPLRTYAPLLTPNDPQGVQPWTTNSKVDQAWDIPTGSHDTLLAVIDTGIDLKHEEFSNRWYVNPGESGPATSEAASRLNCSGRSLPLSASCNLIDDDSDGIVDNETGSTSYQNPSRLNCTAQGKPLTKDCNQIDDDGNGLIDDVSGWDFANNDNSPQAGELNPTGAGTTHGTETTGTAAATGNNGKGIAGVDWHTKILPIQALDDDSYGDTLGVGRAIRYAAARHADVISLSLGSTQPDEYVRQSIAIATAAGSVVVAAAGNTSCDCMVYPANYPEVVSVGALDATNRPASFTSYGTNLDIMAPGTGITAPTWSSTNQTAAYAGNLAGTSFATPIVSGLLTRLLSNKSDSANNITPLQLIADLTENTNRLSLPANISRTSQLGYGALDASKAMARSVTPRTAPIAYGFTPVSKGAYLDTANPLEVTSSYIVQNCPDGQVGTTPLYELSKSTTSFFTISQTEVWQAQNAGYTANLFTEACLQQPQDTYGALRNLNIFKEFRNIYENL